MKLSPMLKFHIIFWTVTLPIIPFVILLVLVAFVNPFYRQGMFRVVENLVYQVTNWRNNIPVVKYYREKAYLFETLKA